HSLGECARITRFIKLLVHDVRRHDGFHITGSYQLRIGSELSFFPCRGYISYPKVRIGVRTAMAGKVFRNAYYAQFPMCLNVFRGQLRNPFFIIGKSTTIPGYDRILWIGRKVDNRGKVHIDSQSGKGCCRGLTVVPHRVEGFYSTHFLCGDGSWKSVFLFKSIDPSTFLVDTNKQWNGSFLLVLPDNLSQPRKGVCLRYVFLEQDDRTDLALPYFRKNSLVELYARNADQDHLTDLNVKAVHILTHG